MTFVDTHAHICSEYDKEPATKIIFEAKNDGVNLIINVGTSIVTSAQVVEVANDHDGVYAAVGIHPTDVMQPSDIAVLEQLIIKNKKVIAIGEIGLDYYHLANGRAPDKETQKRMLGLQLDLALKHNLPVLIHCRDAYEDLYAVIATPKYAKLRGLMHTYAGSLEYAQKFIDLGFYISFSGVLTFKNAKNIHEIAQTIPLTSILTETDTPFLTPAPYRGQKNHTRNVVFVTKKIAELRNESVELIAKQIELNARRLFKI